MKSTKFTGLLTKKKTVWYLVYLLLVCMFAVFVIKLNQMEKTELVVRTGQRRHYLLPDWWKTGN
ncbi:hypothetical protein DW217_17840 [Ruminococcus sp. AM18-15]|nr:hypothetical protein DW217_17840 [Ruminococcus sp. AM18-15]